MTDSAPALTSLHAQISQANQQFMTAFQSRDAVRLGAMYSQKPLLLPPGAELIEGTEPIAAFWKSVMDMGITEVKLETVSVEGVGETAVEVGRYVLMAGAAAVDRGKYLVVWCLEGGSWKLHRDIWNTSVPPSK